MYILSFINGWLMFHNILVNDYLILLQVSYNYWLTYKIWLHRTSYLPTLFIPYSIFQSLNINIYVHIHTYEYISKCIYIYWILLMIMIKCYIYFRVFNSVNGLYNTSFKVIFFEIRLNYKKLILISIVGVLL